MVTITKRAERETILYEEGDEGTNRAPFRTGILSGRAGMSTLEENTVENIVMEIATKFFKDYMEHQYRKHTTAVKQ